MSAQSLEVGSDSSTINNPLSVLQPGERNLCEIKRHPIGIISVFFLNAILMTALAIGLFIIAPYFITSMSRSVIEEIGMLVFIMCALVSIGFLSIVNKVYWSNRWVLTSDSLTQMTQTGLLDKRATQLSLSNLESVTAEQHGLLSHALNFGTLRVETAGEKHIFVFPYCPDPTHFAKQVLDAREKFEQFKDNNNSKTAE